VFVGNASFKNFFQILSNYTVSLFLFGENLFSVCLDSKLKNLIAENHIFQVPVNLNVRYISHQCCGSGPFWTRSGSDLLISKWIRILLVTQQDVYNNGIYSEKYQSKDGGKVQRNAGYEAFNSSDKICIARNCLK